MGKQVKVYTTATNAETGEVVNLAPGDEAPSWAQLGDHVFAEPDEGTPTEPVAGPSQSALSKEQLAQLDEQLSSMNEGEQDLSKLTVAQLQELAQAEGVEVAGDAKKADIIAAIEANR